MGLADKARNVAEDLTGKAKEAVGDAKGDDKMKAEGQGDQTKASAVEVAERGMHQPHLLTTSGSDH